MPDDDLSDFGGQWFDFGTGDSLTYDEVALRLKLPGRTVLAMLEDGELACIAPWQAAAMFGDQHRRWRVYWRGQEHRCHSEPRISE